MEHDLKQLKKENDKKQNGRRPKTIKNGKNKTKNRVTQYN